MTSTPHHHPGPAAVATVWVDTTNVIGTLDENIYGQFLESAFFGNVEGGVLDEGSALSVPGAGPRQGLRTDVMELCREMGVPLVRWPGGNFTSPYQWEDGIGARDDRPRRLELAWGSEETNRFGTDEFLAWCREIGAEAYLAHSARDVDDAVRWVEYTNYAGDTAYTRRRAANGHPYPYRVRYWGVGNEVYGRWQMGHRSALAYAHDAREHAAFMRHVDPAIRTIGVGQPESEEWNRAVLEQAGRQLDYLSLHHYGASNHLVTGDDYDAVVAQSVFFEQRIVEYADLVDHLADRAGLEHRPGLALDEWNVRHLEPTHWPAPQAGADGGIAPRRFDATEGPTATARGEQASRVNRWSPRTLADALCYAGVFHAIHRRCGADVAVTMANPVNLVNANGIIAARPDGALRSAAFGIWKLYQSLAGRTVVANVVDGPARSASIRQGHSYDPHGELATRPGVVPDLDVSTTLTDDRRGLRLVVINRHRSRPVTTSIVVDGQQGTQATVQLHQLGADVTNPNQGNDLDHPDRVALRDLGTVDLSTGVFDFPAHSITVLKIPLG